MYNEIVLFCSRSSIIPPFQELESLGLKIHTVDKIESCVGGDILVFIGDGEFSLDVSTVLKYKRVFIVSSSSEFMKDYLFSFSGLSVNFLIKNEGYIGNIKSMIEADFSNFNLFKNYLLASLEGSFLHEINNGLTVGKFEIRKLKRLGRITKEEHDSIDSVFKRIHNVLGDRFKDFLTSSESWKPGDLKKYF